MIGKPQIVPVFSYQKHSMNDQTVTYSCPYARECDDYYYGNPVAYEKYNPEYQRYLRDPVALAFNRTGEAKANLTFENLYDYCDALESEAFNHNPPRVVMLPA